MSARPPPRRPIPLPAVAAATEPAIRDGREVLAALKEDPDLCPIPVVVLTSSAARADVTESYDQSANAFLTKPVDPEEFISTIDAFAEFWLSTARLPSGAD